METTLIADKTQQATHEPPNRGEKLGTCHTDKTVCGKRREGQVGGNNL